MKLTNDLLLKLGFRGEGKDDTGIPAYRLKVPKHPIYGYFSYEIQIVLDDEYDELNPNSGIVSIYRKELKDMHCISDSSIDELDYVFENIPEENGIKTGIKYVTFPEEIIPIAWHVTTLERLNAIYCALTCNSPLVIK